MSYLDGTDVLGALPRTAFSAARLTAARPSVPSSARVSASQLQPQPQSVQRAAASLTPGASAKAQAAGARAVTSANRFIAASRRLASKKRGKAIGGKALAKGQRALAKANARAAKARTTVVGVNPAMMAVDANALLEALSTQANVLDAMTNLVEIGNKVVDLVDQLDKFGAADFVKSGNAIIDRINALIDVYNPDADPPDVSVIRTVFAIMNDEEVWEAQARARAAAGPAAAPETPAAAAATPAASAEAAPGGFSGGGGSFDESSVDWGDAPPSGEISDEEVDWGEPREQPDLEEDRGFSFDESEVVPNEPPETVETPAAEDETEESMSDQYLEGTDVLGAEGDVTIPSAGTTYTDYATVSAVQKALKARGFDPGAVDGIYGPKTQKAIKAMQAVLGVPQEGIIDYGVLMALKVQAPGAKPKKAPASVPAVFDGGGASSQSVMLAQPSFWAQPLWAGAPVKRWQGLVAGVALIAIGFGVFKAVQR